MSSTWIPLGSSPTAPVIPSGTSLPGSPNDGDEYILVDSTTLPTYAWRFRYSASITDANKWVFVGGSALFATYIPSTAGESTSSTTFVDLTTVGPQLVIPRAGVYEFNWGCGAANNTAGSGAQMALSGGGLTPATAEACYVLAAAANLPQVSMGISRPYTVTAATIKAQYSCLVGGIAVFTRRWMQAIPVRVA